jgi:lysozyme
MSAIQIAGEIAKVFEGYSAKPYRCPAGVPTIGFGTTHYPDGRKVSMSDPVIDEDTALIYLYDELQKSMAGALRYCPILSTDEGKLAAITDFCYNLGIGRLQQSTLRRRINQQNWDACKTELLKWVFAGGKKLPGLVKRRTLEATFF